MKDMGDVVILSSEEYKSLLEDRAKLDALEAYGVDNWSGYGEAMMSMEEDEEE
jgi:hypothetical protein